MKIAIIGNGKIKKKYGRVIDKADIIIRFNHARIKGYEKEIGSRTDILALAGATALSYQNEANGIDPEILNDVSWVLFSGRKTNYEYEQILLNKKSIYNKGAANLIFQYIDNSCYYNLLTEAWPGHMQKGIPSTGINILIYKLYENDYKSGKVKFNVYGFDQFESGHYFGAHNRADAQYHDLEAEKVIIEHLKHYQNIKFFN